MKTIYYGTITGILAILSAWITIAISWHLNPWFSISHDALSDLGGGNPVENGHPSPNFPIVYNGGMEITGFLIMIFSSIMIYQTNNKIETTGFSFFFVAGIFLMLIGIYHEGTYPHDFVSIWFFIMSSIAYLTVFIGVFLRIKNIFPIIGISIIIISWISYILIPWQSVAEGEIYGISIIDIIVILDIIFRIKNNNIHN